jgi:hypothetical protein
MSRNKCFFFSFEYNIFYVLYPFVTSLLTLSCTKIWHKEGKLQKKVRRLGGPQRRSERCGGNAKEQVYRCWWRICREINIFPRFEYRVFCVLYPFVTHLLTLPRISPEASLALILSFFYI